MTLDAPEMQVAGDSTTATGSGAGRSDPNLMEDAAQAQDFYGSLADNVVAGINAAVDWLSTPGNKVLDEIGKTPGGGYVLGKIGEGVNYLTRAADNAGRQTLGEGRWQNYKNWAYGNSEYIAAAENGLTMLGGGGAAIRGANAAQRQLARRGLRSSGNTARNVDNVVGGGQAGPARSFPSFYAFKRAMGPAGEGMEWHHIVGQTRGNLTRFGPEMIHNTNNLVRLPIATHRRVNAFYSSIQVDRTGSKTLTVRQWLSGQSFEEQKDFGLRALEYIQGGGWR